MNDLFMWNSHSSVMIPCVRSAVEGEREERREEGRECRAGGNEAARARVSLMVCFCGASANQVSHTQVCELQLSTLKQLTL